VRQHTTERNGGANQRIEFLVTANGELQVTRGDTLDLQVLGRVSSEFEDFGREVFEDRSNVDGSYSASAQGDGNQGMTGNRPFAPTRILFWVLFLRKRFTRPQGN